jgi:hypothetical protein
VRANREEHSLSEGTHHTAVQNLMEPRAQGLQAAKDASTSQEKIIDIFNRIEHFFRRLEIYAALTPTAAMTDMIVEISANDSWNRDNGSETWSVE